MNDEAELDQVAPGLFIWQRYDSAVKADLFSTAMVTPAGVYLVDPIPIKSAALRPVLEGGEVVGVILTNANHARASAEFAERFHVAIAGKGRPGERPSLEITFIEIEGAAEGEIALHLARDGGTLIMGDALINMDSSGFAFLPAKYCSNHKLMRKSLRQLLDCRFERILFAHGLPILSQAHARLTELLKGSQ